MTGLMLSFNPSTPHSQRSLADSRAIRIGRHTSAYVWPLSSANESYSGPIESSSSRPSPPVRRRSF
ncbi:hypothetical protein ASPCADRAFT_207716 [Aspergillus carbonarius ITEM 5010]|uniref:Uncharacterized protein n=1 Tax=Aspergillus carbonarius (strain ITEM 5010) TaxID=602072 RepID=A0A1R3RL76_ASPC5|nr:hypothetical protein ASPCADRAFT_207716 [Aspergillus carbonarius ITEM 5010]